MEVPRREASNKTTGWKFSGSKWKQMEMAISIWLPPLIISDPEKVVFVKFIHDHSEVVAIHRACEFAARQRKQAKLEVSRWRRQKLSRASSVSSRLSAFGSGRINSVVY